MRVFVTNEAVTDILLNEAPLLHDLFSFSRSGQHLIIFEEPKLALDNWLEHEVDKGSVPWYQTCLDNDLRQSTSLSSESTLTVLIKKTDQAIWYDDKVILGIKDALKLLKKPLSICVENINNDWSFLRGILKVVLLEHDIKRLNNAIEQGWVRAVHGGGQSLEIELKKRIDSPLYKFRTFTLFDSDRRHPDELSSNWQPTMKCTGFNFQKIVKTALANQYWMLVRRSIESYMPKTEMAKLLERSTRGLTQDKIDTFFRMTEKQRWYYNMKKGFQDDNTVENRQRYHNLYQSVSAKDQNTLANGFGNKLAHHYIESIDRNFAWDEEAKNEARTQYPKLLRLL